MRIAGLCICLAALVTPAAAQKVTVDHDRAVNFSQYSTFAWKEGTQASNELTQQRITKGIEDQLTAKGLERVEGPADVYVIALAVVDQQTKSRATSIGIGVSKRTKRGGISVGGSTGGRPRQVNVGTLVIDLLDGGSEALVWQAIGSDTLSSSPQKNAEKAQKAIEKAFKDFPPKSE